MELEKLFQNKQLQKWVKAIGIGIAIMWIVREVFMMFAFTSMFNFVTGGIKGQETAMKNMQAKADDTMGEFSKGAEDITKGMSEGIDRDREKFFKDFEESLAPHLEEFEHRFDDLAKFSHEQDEEAKNIIAEYKKNVKEDSERFWRENSWENVKEDKPKKGH